MSLCYVEAVMAGGEALDKAEAAQHLQLLADFGADVAVGTMSALIFLWCAQNQQVEQNCLIHFGIAWQFWEFGANMSETAKRLKKLTMLTPHEDHYWVFALNYYLDEGKSDDEADRLGWRDLRMEFPRLRGFDGCLADTPGPKANPKWSARPVIIRS